MFFYRDIDYQFFFRVQKIHIKLLALRSAIPLVSVDVTALGRTNIHFVEPDVKIIAVNRTSC